MLKVRGERGEWSGAEARPDAASTGNPLNKRSGSLVLECSPTESSIPKVTALAVCGASASFSCPRLLSLSLENTVLLRTLRNARKRREGRRCEYGGMFKSWKWEWVGERCALVYGVAHDHTGREPWEQASASGERVRLGEMAEE